MKSPILFENLPNEIRTRLFASARGRRVVFPESADERIQQAAALLSSSAGVHCELISADVIAKFKSQTESVIAQQAQARGKVVPSDLSVLASDPFFTAGAMLQLGHADAAVGGAVATTSHVIRAALSTVGVDPKALLITSCFLFKLRAPTDGGEDVVLYADAGVVPQPSEAQLPKIASLAAQAFSHWTAREPRVGFLSFSTSGSAEHPDVSKVRNAAAAFAHMNPEIISEGELQFDAAVVPQVALRKNPSSRLAGRTNVFVFPDLDAGNIAYKITQRLAGAEAWGPLLLGTGKPYSDLSRGASVLDIAHVALLTLALAKGDGSAVLTP
jgi:phosphate acetyltransferase